MTVTEYREKSIPELENELKTLLKQQFELRMKKATDQLTQTHLIKQVRTAIARVKTIIQEKSAGERK